MLRMVLLALVLSFGAAQADDVKGARDYPGIGRFAGSSIIGYQNLPHDEFKLPLAPVKTDEQFQWVLPDVREIEGKVTGFVYAVPPGKSSLEVFRNYQNALKNVGYAVLFKCELEECGNEQVLAQKVYRDSHIMANSDIASAQAAMYGEDIRYLVAQKTAAPESYVSLLVAREAHVRQPDSVSVVMHVIEPKGMGQSMVFVDAAKMSGDISAQGHVALYGIYFDTGSAEVKPTSDPTLAEIAKMMKESNRKVIVVGHTDTQGGFDYNMDLSTRRAKAVADVLAKRYGIQQARLQAAGVGYLAPVASNASDEGRAKNRRVELVQQE
jgi:OmpA-OmpF porin, OOP family